MISGVINVYKEKGMTSHDVIWHMRHILNQKKIGHTGTLDPDAEGVLPVCLGMGTRLCERLQQGEKEYQAVLLLGVTTDTQDISGTVLKELPVETDEEQVLDCIQSFVGTRVQVPPMYSAVKINGKKLYELARKGIEVDRKGRQIEISSIQINSIRLPEVTLTVTCSRGTYIRTLCEDIGASLGCGGCMKSLVRLRCGDFGAESALKLNHIRELAERGELASYILPVDYFFPEAGKAHVTQDCDVALYNGNAFPAAKLRLKEGSSWEKTMRLYDSAGNFVGIFQMGQDRICRPLKMFWQQ